MEFTKKELIAIKKGIEDLESGRIHSHDEVMVLVKKRIEKMKKIITIIIITLLLSSCGPRRMSCYGKRCVENSIEKESKIKLTLKRNS